MLELFVKVASYYNIVGHELPLLISHCFVALFFIFFHGRNTREGFVHNVMHVPILVFRFSVFFLGLNYFYSDAFVVEAIILFLLIIATLHDFHMSNSSCFLSYDLGCWVKPKSIVWFS